MPRSKFYRLITCCLWRSCVLPLILFGLREREAVAQVPVILNYQGRAAVGGTLFDGQGQFKFALVNADGSIVYWRNAPDGDANGEPDAAVSVPVAKGLFTIFLGETSLANMAAIPATAFTNSAVYIRTWFSDTATGFERLQPDQRIAAVGYALMAAAVADGTVAMRKLVEQRNLNDSHSGLATRPPARD